MAELPLESGYDSDLAEVCSQVTNLSQLGPSASAAGAHRAFPWSTAACQLWPPAPPAAGRGSSPQQPFSSDHKVQQPVVWLMVGQGQPSENATRKRGHRRRVGRRERRKQKQQMRAAHSAAGSHSDGAAPQQTSDEDSLIKVDMEVEGELTKAYVDEQIRRRDEAIAHLSKQMEAMRPALEQMSTLKQELDGAKSQIKQLRSEQSRLQDTARAGMAKLEALKGADAEVEKMRLASKELVEELNQLKRDKDELAAELADVQGSMQKNRAETAYKILQMKTCNDVSYEQLSKQTSELKHTVAQLTDTTQAAVQDVAALKERMVEMEAKALKSVATKEEVEKHLDQLKLDKDATIESLPGVTGALDVAVKDAVSAAMKDGPERELQCVKASLKELSSPQSAAPLQSPPRTIHAFDVFAHLGFGDQTRITVTLVRGSDASILASAVAPSCKRCWDNPKSLWLVDDTEALRQCVTRLLASHGGAGGPEQRWAYVDYYQNDNLSYISTLDLGKRKPLPYGSCKSRDVRSRDVRSVEWFQAWLRSSSPDSAITHADVTSPNLFWGMLYSMCPLASVRVVGHHLRQQ